MNLSKYPSAAFKFAMGFPLKGWALTAVRQRQDQGDAPLSSMCRVTAALAGVNVVSLFSPLQPRDSMCRRGVCSCQQQHLRCGSRLQLQGGRYSTNPSSPDSTVLHAALLCRDREHSPAQDCRLALGHVFITSHTSCGESLLPSLRALYSFFNDIAKEQLSSSFC